VTDFLTQLVARSSGSAEAVRPRLISIFEPAPPAVGPVAGPVAAPEISYELPVAEETPLGARLSGERPASPVAESIALQPEQPVHEPGQEGAAMRAKPSPPPLPLVSHVAESVAAQREYPSHETRAVAAVLATKSGPPLVPPEGRDSAPRANLAPLPDAQTRRSPPQAHSVRLNPAAQATQPGTLFPLTPTPATGPDGETQGVSPGASGRAAGLQSERVAAHDRGNALGFRPLDESYLIPQPLPTNSTLLPHASAARESERARTSATRLAAESEPVIQVTIGRVEVRAGSSPALAASKERSTPPVMSLGEYLRRRSQRGRE
jgi:hypothetical protein